ncbi:uncharacterized protein LOC127265881 [Andrographis paniculata]|uniref:uncharacterized protein LOC127265881 n=1 Tax=Andrographis paniculata TaxID=175694 RepID=UPI0021E96076|nr:uncharacterized protein LOC127265881 [Andrographis paniculata]
MGQVYVGGDLGEVIKIQKVSVGGKIGGSMSNSRGGGVRRAIQGPEFDPSSDESQYPVPAHVPTEAPSQDFFRQFMAAMMPQQRSFIDAVMRHNPPTYSGSVEPGVLEFWVEKMEKIFRVVQAEQIGGG